MTRSRRVTILALVAAVLAACSAGTTPVPSASAPTPSPSAAGSEAACGPSPSACPIPSAFASSSPAPASASPCPVATVTLGLSSDRMTSVEVRPGPTEDVVRFVFGPPHVAPTAGAPTVLVEPRAPPFVADPSGLPLDVAGARVVMVRMGVGMWLYDDAGVPTYGGPRRFDEPGPGVRSVVLGGAFEGYETWLIGFDGPGCVSVRRAVDGSLEVRIAHA